MDHGTDRIEAMGSDAVVIGSDGKDLHFTSVSLGDVPQPADDYVEKGASQGELRSHGFFYKAEAEDSGMLGLPVSVPARARLPPPFETSAAIVFLKSDGLRFARLGTVGSTAGECEGRRMPGVVRGLVRQFPAVVRTRENHRVVGIRDGRRGG